MLTGIAGARRSRRIKDVLLQFNLELNNLKEAAPQAVIDYAHSEEFEDLVVEAFSRAARERDEEKRRMYGRILADAVRAPDTTYEESLRHIRVLEELQPSHILILRAYVNEKDVGPLGWAGSIGQTLRRRSAQRGGLLVAAPGLVRTESQLPSQ